MVLIQIEIDRDLDKKIKQHMLNNDIEIKAQAIVSLLKYTFNEANKK